MDLCCPQLVERFKGAVTVKQIESCWGRLFDKYKAARALEGHTGGGDGDADREVGAGSDEEEDEDDDLSDSGKSPDESAATDPGLNPLSDCSTLYQCTDYTHRV
jgi:hypothetical protein